MFVCAHPAIDPAARSALMLQTVLGLDAARIASAFLVAPATLSQRLVRAKTKIRAAGDRLRGARATTNGRSGSADVLEAIYAAYGTGWDDVAGTDAQIRGLGGTRRSTLARDADDACCPTRPKPGGCWR